MQEKTICASPNGVIKNEHSVTRRVQRADVAADGATGLRILKAGTIVGSATGNIITDNQPIVQKNDANGKGILINDVDVTNGDMEGAVLVKGVAKNAWVKAANGGTINVAVDFKGAILLTDSAMNY